MVKDIVYTGKDSWGDVRTYSLNSELNLYKEIQKSVWKELKKRWMQDSKEAPDDKLLDFYKKIRPYFKEMLMAKKELSTTSKRV